MGAFKGIQKRRRSKDQKILYQIILYSKRTRVELVKQEYIKLDLCFPTFSVIKCNCLLALFLKCNSPKSCRKLTLINYSTKFPTQICCATEIRTVFYRKVNFILDALACIQLYIICGCILRLNHKCSFE